MWDNDKAEEEGEVEMILKGAEIEVSAMRISDWYKSLGILGIHAIEELTSLD